MTMSVICHTCGSKMLTLFYSVVCERCESLKDVPPGWYIGYTWAVRSDEFEPEKIYTKFVYESEIELRSTLSMFSNIQIIRLASPLAFTYATPQMNHFDYEIVYRLTVDASKVSSYADLDVVYTTREQVVLAKPIN